MDNIYEINDIKVEPYDEAKHGPMDGYDFSTLNAVDGCAVKGIISNVLGKRFDEPKQRNMALEAGDLCHKCFAVLRALTLTKEQVCKFLLQAVPTMTQETFESLLQKSDEQITPVSKQMIFVDYILENGGFYDDENDKKRTLANIRNTLLAYCSNFNDMVHEEPVYVDEKGFVGIELPFDYVITITYNDKVIQNFRFIGKIDGLHVYKDGSLILHENKTASRLDDSWLGQWETSHQITGYCLIAQAITGKPCKKARVIGAQIPVPKMSGYAYRSERVDREVYYFENWARWVITQLEVVDSYKQCPHLAPMSTKNCCAYYSKCALLPLCVLDEDSRKEMIEQMIVDKWSPLDD